MGFWKESALSEKASLLNSSEASGSKMRRVDLLVSRKLIILFRLPVSRSSFFQRSILRSRSSSGVIFVSPEIIGVTPGVLICVPCTLVAEAKSEDLVDTGLLSNDGLSLLSGSVFFAMVCPKGIASELESVSGKTDGIICFGSSPSDNSFSSSPLSLVRSPSRNAKSRAASCLQCSPDLEYGHEQYMLLI